MKAIRERSRILFLALGLALAVFLMAGCANPVADVLNADEWGLVGTWVATSGFAAPSPNNSAKLILNADGTFKAADQSGTMFTTGQYTIAGVSIKKDTRTYQLDFVMSPAMTHTYQLARITDATTYELNAAPLPPYPSSINTSDPNYFKYTRK